MIEEFKGKYRFLSNFWLTPIEYEGRQFTSSEAAYQASKCSDYNMKDTFIGLSPGDSKRQGRRVIIRGDWGDVKLGIMFDILQIKFSDPELTKKLLDTGEQNLVEGNYWGDIYWGVCKGVGENHLGKILMKIRKENGDG